MSVLTINSKREEHFGTEYDFTARGGALDLTTTIRSAQNLASKIGPLQCNFHEKSYPYNALFSKFLEFLQFSKKKGNFSSAIFLQNWSILCQFYQKTRLFSQIPTLKVQFSAVL